MEINEKELIKLGFKKGEGGLVIELEQCELLAEPSNSTPSFFDIEWGFYAFDSTRDTKVFTPILLTKHLGKLKQLLKIMSYA